MPFKDPNKDREYHRKLYKKKSQDPEFRRKKAEKSRLWRLKRLDYCREKERGRQRKRNGRIKMEVLRRYGGNSPSCACCGETIKEFLTIHHIGGGGNKHRKEIDRVGHRFYEWLRDQGYPQDYEVLCFNCNWAKGHYGYCPHELLKANKDANKRLLA